MEKARRIHFIRHGTPVGLKEVYAGRMDRPLTEQGREEAVRTGKWFATQGFTGLVYSSPLIRAYDTAKLIVEEICKHNKSYECNIKTNDKLMELNIGIFEGTRKDEFNKKYSVEAPLWYTDPFNNAFPGGESIAECAVRFSEGVQEILEENEDNDKDIIITAHRVVIEAYFVLNKILNFEINLDNGKTPCSSISTIVYEPDGTLYAERLGWQAE